MTTSPRRVLLFVVLVLILAGGGAWLASFASGARVLGDGEPRIGAHGKPVLFLHPKDFNGTLIELEQV